MAEIQQRSVLYLEAIKRIVSRLAHFDQLQDLLDHGVASVQRELDFYIASIFWYDRDSERALLLAQEGQSADPVPIGYTQPIGVGVVGRVLREGVSLCIDDVRIQSDYVTPAGYEPAASELCVPIASDGQLWGAFNMESTVPAAFNYADQLSMEVIAAQLGSAIYNLALRDEQHRLMSDLSAQSARQELLLAEVQRLGTPIFPIFPNTLALPLIGALDDARMFHVTETLLASIQHTRSRVILLDITGITTIDDAVAQRLLQLGRMVRLLGAELVLTGVRPEVAQSLVSLHTNLTALSIRRDFAAGIRYALQVSDKQR